MQALLPESDNATVLAQAPYNVSRKGKRITNAQEADWGLPTMMMVQKQQTRLVVLDLVMQV